MRTGYAIRDTKGHAWLKTRERVEGVDVPVTVWVQDEDEALIFHRLPDAKRMARVVRASSRHPDKIHVLTPAWKAVG
ncbi:MAG: hypothetical protein IJH38_04375 [Clostridia bacterium]|nr:hypothetical protein [Clostridia bacterium]